ncbi:MAG: hypothetical protein KGD59_00420 [Candidatus Heimdallarchaeota archaeon]|nr:hypothetical protein [Candidatus Heimdallarchaeota archaeon]MBY8992980.1 hypothetical protein [Candidatus Heimdallarchaeota archaeon]
MTLKETYPVKFKIDGGGEVKGEFYRVKAPHSVENIWYALPLSGRVRVQDNAQAYFLIDIQVKQERPTFDVNPGDIAYWPMSKAICVFWEKIRPYSEVNIIGKITGDLNLFKTMKNLTRVVLEKDE